MNKDCLSCKVTSGKIATPGGILFENKLITITHSIPPAQSKGFLIVQPKRHIEHIAELTRFEMQEICTAIYISSQSITQALVPEKVYVCSFGETVKHVHFYVIPRLAEMPHRGITVLTQMLDEGLWNCSNEEAEEASNKIKPILIKLYKNL
jgi:diadenosine tetraphosphate (Ap4A) HIT family hydrolase